MNESWKKKNKKMCSLMELHIADKNLIHLSSGVLVDGGLIRGWWCNKNRKDTISQYNQIQFHFKVRLTAAILV